MAVGSAAQAAPLRSPSCCSHCCTSMMPWTVERRQEGGGSEATCAWGRSWEGWGLRLGVAWPSSCWQADSKAPTSVPMGGEGGRGKPGCSVWPPWELRAHLHSCPIHHIPQCCAVGRMAQRVTFGFVKLSAYKWFFKGSWSGGTENEGVGRRGPGRLRDLPRVQAVEM